MRTGELEYERIMLKSYGAQKDLRHGSIRLEGVPEYMVPRLREDDYEQIERHFYKRRGLLYAYLGKDVGGAIEFLGKGRWSSRAESLGADLYGRYGTMADIVVNGHFGYAINEWLLETLLGKHFKAIDPWIARRPYDSSGLSVLWLARTSEQFEIVVGEEVPS
jgi:hypothetical protein